jgi:hypothetical protein
MRRIAWAVGGVFLLLAAAGLAGQDKPRVGPPPLRTEAKTLQPSPAHVWIPGCWKWAGINYEWVEGRWVKGKKGKVWEPGTWEQAGAHWVWKPGKWVKPEKAKEPKKGKKDDKDKKGEKDKKAP